MPPQNYFSPLVAASLSLAPLGIFSLSAQAQDSTSKAQPTKAEKAFQITIQVIPHMVKFDTTEFEVSAGKPVELTFKNACIMPHNLLILPKDAEPKVVNAVNALGAEGFEKGFVPEVPEIVVASKLLPSNASEVLKFTAPAAPGEYLFLCTFPGHWFTMRGVMRVRADGQKLAKTKKDNSNEVVVPDALKESGVTHKPVGTFAKPLVMRTFLPDPGLDGEVFAHHGTAKPAKKYDPATRQDIETVGKNADPKDLAARPLVSKPEAGIPGAIAVSHGPEFAYAWDTTECRLLYVWRGGFLDMNPYWGKEPGGGRDRLYIPRIVGRLVYRTSGSAPLAAPNDGVPQFGGYKMVGNAPEFFYKLGAKTVRERLVPKQEGGFDIQVQVEGGGNSTAWKVSEKDKDAVEVESKGSGAFAVHVKDRQEAPLDTSKGKSAHATENE
ncbi:MAG: plastocyanin/azurin family copper-binding protein [Verrucomicrobiota bacterium]